MDEDLRPEISPYTLPSVALYFAGGCILYIPPHLLAQSHELKALYLDNPLHVLDVPDDAGHVLVHYLITGTYQSLKLRDLSPQDELAAEFSTSIRAYNAAKTYALPNLAEFAKGEIERLGEGLQFSLVFDLFREAYPNPNTDDVWLNSYLKSRLKTFFSSSLMKSTESKAAIPQKTVPISHIIFNGMLELVRDNTILLCEEIEQAAKKTEEQVNKEAAIAEEEAEIARLIDKRDNSFLGLNKLGEQRLHLLEAKAKSRAEEQAARQAAIEAERAKEEAERVAHETEKAAKEAREQEALEAAAIAVEEEEIAYLLNKKAKRKGRLLKAHEEKLVELQANATRRAQEKAAREAIEQAAREAKKAAREAEQAVKEAKQALKEAEQALKEAEQALKEDKGKGIKSKKGKKGRKNIDNNMIKADALLGQVEDFLVVKTHQEATHDDDKENEDESRTLPDQKASKAENKEKDSETNVPVVPVIDTPQATSLDNDQEYMNDEGWSFWGLGKNKKSEDLAHPSPRRIHEETEFREHTVETLDEAYKEIVKN